METILAWIWGIIVLCFGVFVAHTLFGYSWWDGTRKPFVLRFAGVLVNLYVTLPAAVATFLTPFLLMDERQTSHSVAFTTIYPIVFSLFVIWALGVFIYHRVNEKKIKEIRRKERAKQAIQDPEFQAMLARNRKETAMRQMRLEKVDKYLMDKYLSKPNLTQEDKATIMRLREELLNPRNDLMLKQLEAIMQNY